MKKISLSILLCILFTNQLFSESNNVKVVDDYNPISRIMTNLNKSQKKAVFNNYNLYNKKSFIFENNNFYEIDQDGKKVKINHLGKYNFEKPIHEKWGNRGDKVIASVLTWSKGNKSRAIAIFSLDGSINTIFSNDPSSFATQPCFSFDDQFIAFMQTNPATHLSNIVISDINEHQTIVVDEPQAGNPVWFNHSNKLLYKQFQPYSKSDSRKIVLYDLESRSKKVLYEGVVKMSYPLLSPNDSLIVLRTDKESIVIDINGNIVKKLKNVGGTMKWSPDSQKISYIRGSYTHDGEIIHESLFYTDINTNIEVELTPNKNLNGKKYMWMGNSIIIE